MYLRVLAKISQNKMFVWHVSCTFLDYLSPTGFRSCSLNKHFQVRNRQVKSINVIGQEDRA